MLYLLRVEEKALCSGVESQVAVGSPFQSARILDDAIPEERSGTKPGITIHDKGLSQCTSPRDPLLCRAGPVFYARFACGVAHRRGLIPPADSPLTRWANGLRQRVKSHKPFIFKAFQAPSRRGKVPIGKPPMNFSRRWTGFFAGNSYNTHSRGIQTPGPRTSESRFPGDDVG